VAARSSSLPEMKGVQLDVGRVDMTLCKNASNGNMHVCFSCRAIVARTESASHGLARASARRGRRFFKTNVTRFKQNKGRKSPSELKSQRLSQRREAGGAQAKRWHWRRGNEVTHTPTLRETTHLARISAFPPSLDNRRRVCAGTGRNVLSCALVRMQRRRKLRTWTSTRLDGFGFHQDPQHDGVECLGISGRRS